MFTLVLKRRYAKRPIKGMLMKAKKSHIGLVTTAASIMPMAPRETIP